MAANMQLVLKKCFNSIKTIETLEIKLTDEMSYLVLFLASIP